MQGDGVFSFPEVALDFMNRDHADFAQLCAEILEHLPSAEHGAIAGLLDTLLQHTSDHFRAEEKVMTEYGFPPYAIHKQEHDRVLADMSRRVQQWKSDGDNAALRAWLAGPVAEWFAQHVATMDFVTARYVVNQGTTTTTPGG